MKQLIYIGIAGAFGAMARYLMVIMVHSFTSRQFPYGTLSVNILGSFLLGLLGIVLLNEFNVAVETRNAIFIGFLGAFTTFSTFSVDTINLMMAGRNMLALSNIAASFIFCLLAAWAGISLGRHW